MAEATVTVSVQADLSPIVALLSSPPDFLLQAINRGLDLGEFISEAFRLETDDLTATTGELVVRAYPTDWLRGFLAAGRTGNL